MKRSALTFLLFSVILTACQPQSIPAESVSPSKLPDPTLTPPASGLIYALPPKNTPTQKPATPATPSSDKILSAMTLEQKIGQLMVIGFDGTTPAPELLDMLTQYHIGGVIIFDRNVQSPQQLATLTNDLQQTALASGNPGLFIAVDQEGGRVARLTEDTGFTEFPSAMALAATGDPNNAYRAAAAMAAEMRAVGINVDFAPDLDVDTNPINPVIGIRAFSSDPQKVVEYGLAFARGLQDNGILAIGKHFPGHGDTSTDSHLDLPLVPFDRPHLDQVELAPFRAASAADFAGIMSAHVSFPALDPTPNLAATLSQPILTGLLRDELGFNGLIVTDSLDMGALTTTGYPPPVGAPLALAAGADLLTFDRDHAVHRAAFANLVQAVKDGKISQSRLDAAVRRILQTKARFGLLKPPPVEVSAAAASVKTPEHLALSRELAQKAITLLHDPQGLLPLKSAPLIIEPEALRGLTQLLGQDATILAVDAQPTNTQIAEVLRAAGAGRTIIVPVNDLDINPKQLKLVQELVDASRPVIVIAHRNPYDAAELPETVTVLVTYGFNPPIRAALTAVLTGAIQPTGVLPVTLP